MAVFFYLIYILNIIKFSFQYYDMKFGHIFMNYYNETDCIGVPIKSITYSIEDQKRLYFLNSESIIDDYPYSFDFFSTTIYYSVTEGEEEHEDDDTRRGILCNGLCYARQDGSDILIPSETELAPDYESENQKARYYSCVFNNIIKNATIKLQKFSDKHCKNKLGFDSRNFYGNQSCWKFDNYSYKPLYFEDDGKRLYYHLYNNDSNCISDHYEYYDFNGYYFECDGGCYRDKNDEKKYYKCDFNSAENKYIQNIAYFYLIIFIIIFI